MRESLARRLCATLAIAALAFTAHASGGLRPVQTALDDLRFGWTERAPTGAIVLVDIDAKSLSAMGTWPWPRSAHGRIVDRLRELGASEIALDIDFSTASTEAEDAALEAALARAGGTVILAAFTQDESAAPGSATIANAPIPRFARHAWAATVNVMPDPDGAVRFFPLGGSIDGVATPSVPALLGGFSGSPAGSIGIDFGIGGEAIDRISASDLLDGSVAPERIAGRSVIVGASAVELRDLFRVPRYGIVSGTMVQALAAESVRQGRSLAPSGNDAVLAGFGVFALIGLAIRRRRWTTAIAAIILAGLCIEATATALLAARPIMLETAPVQAALAGLALWVLLSEIGVKRLVALLSRTEAANSQTILSQVVADSFEGVVVVDEDGLIRVASRSAARLLDVGDPEVLVGRRAGDALPPRLYDEVQSAFSMLRAGLWRETGPQVHEETTGRHAGRILEFVATPSRLGGGRRADGKALPDALVASLTFADVTESRRAQARLAALAQFDTLTGLLNRPRFCEKVDEALSAWAERGERFAVLSFDLDRFNLVVDTLGHRYGDLVLQAVARRLQGGIGPRSFMARFEGDTYAVLACGADAADGGATLARALVRSGSEPYEAEGRRVLTSLHVGIAVPMPGVDALSLVRQAGAALRGAKAEGGEGVFTYRSKMDAGLQRRQTLEVALWDAFEAERFEVHYQPQVHLRTGAICGVEALLRWRNADGGFTSPAEFVPVAEAVGLIGPLGAWVMRHACHTVAAWPKPIRLAVNVSPIQFTRGRLVEHVREALALSGLDPARLDLEITESLFVSGGGAVSQIIEDIRRMGVSFALDDFGVGYSSLGYLTSFPVKKLKIDKSFVDDVVTRPEPAAIIRAIASLARSLKIRVNAEGIETAEQAAVLTGLGCDEGQGWLFGRPLAGADIARRLREEDGQRLSA